MAEPHHQGFPSDRPSPGGRLALLVAAGMIAAAVARIALTSHTFSQTWDEPAHIAAGLEWLQKGRYTFETFHPPLARVFTALGPYLAGARLGDDPNLWIEGNRVLGSGAHYDRMLALARAGSLPFFVLAALAVFALARRAGGPVVGALAVLLFSTLPPVLAHAGLTTTDMALAAGLMLALWAFVAWLEHPTLGRGAVFGAAAGIAVLSKFSALLFLPAAMGVILAVRRWFGIRTRAAPGAGAVPLHRRLRPVWVSAAIVLWAGYRFSVGPIVPEGWTDPCGAPGSGCAENGLTRAAIAAGRIPVFPAPELIRGVVWTARSGGVGRKAYLLGEWKWGGFWAFFPVAIGLKTPLAFLLLSAIGIVALARSPDRARGWVGLATAAAAVVIVLVCLPMRINIGLRHVLPIYPLLAVPAAVGVRELWRRRRPALVGPATAAALLGWQVVASARAHPDYLAYFNELARGEPERYLVDSDLDWGQDLKRLADTLRSRGISALALSYSGSTDPAAVGIRNVRWLERHRPDTGWIAISVFNLKLGSWNGPTSDDFAWLERFRPVARVGRSILLYRIESGDSTQ